VNKLDGFAERARNCEGAGCEKVVRDMIDSNIEVQEDIKLACSISAELCQQKYGYLVDQWSVFETTVKHMAEDETLPSDFRNALAPVYTLSMEAEGIMANQGWTERFEAMGFDKVTAGAMAATLPALIAGTKGAKAPTTQVVTKNVNPGSLISRQNSNEMSGSQVKRIAKDMKANGYNADEPVDVAIVNGKMIIIDGHHRAEAARKAGIKNIPVRVYPVTKEQGDQLLREAAEARMR